MDSADWRRAARRRRGRRAALVALAAGVGAGALAACGPATTAGGRSFRFGFLDAAPGAARADGAAGAAGVAGAVPGPAQLSARRLALRREDLPPELELVEELAPDLSWRTAAEDPAGRVASYAATFRRRLGDGPSAPPVREVVCSVNTYSDAPHAREAFASWCELMPRRYRLLGNGRWRLDLSDEADRGTARADAPQIAAFAGEQPGTAIAFVGFRAENVLGSVWVATDALLPATDGRAFDEAPPAVEQALRLARLVALRIPRLAT